MSTQLHMMNPGSKHLFQRAIMLHGTALTEELPAKEDHTKMIRKFGNNERSLA